MAEGSAGAGAVTAAEGAWGAAGSEGARKGAILSVVGCGVVVAEAGAAVIQWRCAAQPAVPSTVAAARRPKAAVRRPCRVIRRSR